MSFSDFISDPFVLSLMIFFLIIYGFFFIWPWLFGAPYQPTNEKKLKKMIKLARIKKGKDVAADIGSGDGRLVIALAKAGAKQAHGYEINPFLVWLSRRKIRKKGLQKKAIIHWKNFWKTNLKKYDVILLFQFPTIMKRLKSKFYKELKPGTRIVSYNWKLPNWRPSKVIDSNVYLYKV